MPFLMSVDRRRFLGYFSAAGLSATLFPGTLYARIEEGERITVETIAAAERIAGLEFTPEQREMMVEDLTERLGTYESLRALPLPNDVPPALVFDPTIAGVQPRAEAGGAGFVLPEIERPPSDEDVAYLSVLELSSLIRSRQLTCVDAARLFLGRLKRYDSVLHAVVTFTEERALTQARMLDRELDEGSWRGLLHGVPYGAKDLLAVKGYPTTWGATPYRTQEIDADATVVQKLDAAGAVLVAKLTLGALAWGDVWFGGTTRNPWNIEQGSSGSSAGPGSAVAAGLVPFGIGSETLGSIVSPSTRNGVTGHRPTFGLVSRHGAMALSWSMDKLGPMARSAQDCAVVFDAIRGADPADPATVDSAFPFDSDADISQLRVGFLPEAFDADYPNRAADQETISVVRQIGVDLVPLELPTDLPISAMLLTLEVEAAAAFDELTRSGEADTLVRQTKDAWPHVFRIGRLVPAVEYVQANRARSVLMREMTERLRDIDVFLSPAFGGGTLSITNLTGHPCVSVPNSFAPVEDAPVAGRRRPGSITFVGNLFRDAEMLMLAHAYQRRTNFHSQRPPIR